jgi:hypothetical protein
MGSDPNCSRRSKQNLGFAMQPLCWVLRSSTHHSRLPSCRCGYPHLADKETQVYRDWNNEPTWVESGRTWLWTQTSGLEDTLLLASHEAAFLGTFRRTLEEVRVTSLSYQQLSSYHAKSGQSPRGQGQIASAWVEPWLGTCDQGLPSPALWLWAHGLFLCGSFTHFHEEQMRHSFL